MPQMGERINWSFMLMLCGVCGLATATTQMPQGRQEALGLARHAIEFQGGGRIARKHRNQYRIAFRDGGVSVSPLAADTGATSIWV